jgi:hypothetical protein
MSATPMTEGATMRQLRGFLPWITYSAAAALLDWRFALVGALVVAVAALVTSRRTASTDMFTVAAVVFFAGLTVVAVVAPASGVHRYVGALTPAALAVAALVSIAIGQPFTMPFAKRVAPVEVWDTPMFLHINVVLSAVWATSFAAMAAVIAAVLALHPEAVGIIITAQVLGFVIPMRISRWYPASIRARALAA